MNLPQRTRKGHEATRSHQAYGQPVENVSLICQRRRYNTPHPSGAYSLRCRVHRQNLGMRLHFLRLCGNDLKERSLHLMKAIRKGHGARKGDFVSFVELLCHPRLAKENRRHHAGCIDCFNFNNAHPRTRMLNGYFFNLCPYGNVGAYGCIRNARLRRKIEVPMRDMYQQITHARNAETSKRLGTIFSNITKTANLITQRAGFLYTVGSLTYAGARFHTSLLSLL